MKAKNIAVIVIVFVGVMFLLSIPASAEQAWYECTINMAGPGSSSTYIILTDTAAAPEFTNKWFVATADRAKEMLVVALTAISNDLMVKVRIDLDDGDVPSIRTLFLMDE